MIGKMLGAMLIVYAAYCLGAVKAVIYKNRVRRLEELLLCLEMFKAEINYGLSLLPEVFRSIAINVKGPVGELFNRSTEYMKQQTGLSAGECWDRALQDRHVNLEMDKDQLALLKKMGLIWGRGEKTDQLKQVALIQELLRQALQEARQEREKNEKMWRYLGLLGGFALVILLL